MLFNQYLSESYTRPLLGILGEFKKEVGDWFATQGHSVEKMNFEEVPLGKSCKFNKIFDYVNEHLAQMSRKDTRKSRGADSIYVICKHVSHGITTCCVRTSGSKLIIKYKDLYHSRLDSNYWEFGDTSGNVSRCFVAYSKYDPEEYDFAASYFDAKDLDGIKVYGSRYRAAHDLKLTPKEPSHTDKIKDATKYLATLNDVRKKLRALAYKCGILDFDIYTQRDDTGYSLHVEYADWQAFDTKVPVNIFFRDKSDGYENLDDKINVRFSIWYIRTPENFDQEIHQFSQAFDNVSHKLQKLCDLNDYINTLTVKDILKEDNNVRHYKLWSK
mgnify:CR=1 FL=1